MFENPRLLCMPQEMCPRPNNYLKTALLVSVNGLRIVTKDLTTVRIDGDGPNLNQAGQQQPRVGYYSEKSSINTGNFYDDPLQFVKNKRIAVFISFTHILSTRSHVFSIFNKDECGCIQPKPGNITELMTDKHCSGLDQQNWKLHKPFGVEIGNLPPPKNKNQRVLEMFSF